jgi:hypothetical protein
MAEKIKKSEGPSCACGKEDLYEEWVKLNETKKLNLLDSSSSRKADYDNNSADDSSKENQKRVRTKK